MKMRIITVAAALFAVACTGNYMEINTKPYTPGAEDLEHNGYATASFLKAIYGTVVSPDVNTTQFTECLLGGTQGGYFADSQNGWTATISNYNPTNDWSRVFMNSDRIIPTLYANLSQLKGVTEDPIILSIAEIVKVAAMHRVTDTYGPIPYSEAGVSGSVQVAYDTQKDVYLQMFSELDHAIGVLREHKGEAIPASNDPIYGGQADQWRKFANSLKLRMAMRVVYVQDFKTEDGRGVQQLVEECVADGVMTTNADNAVYSSVLFGKDGNPLRAACLYNQPKGCVTGGDTHAAADIICYMNGYSDPRREKYFVKSEWDGIDYVGLRRGIKIPSLEKFGRKYSGVKFVDDAATSIYWMNAAEVAFLKAEAQGIFGFNVGGDAKSLYEEGIRLSFEQWGVGGYESYIQGTTPAQPYIDPNGGQETDKDNVLSKLGVAWDEGAKPAEMQERIITQKWIANWQLGNESWADYRRTGFPRLLPATENKSILVNAKLGARRMPYPTEETTSNPVNYAKAVEYLGGPDNMATRMWWDCNPSIN